MLSAIAFFLALSALADRSPADPALIARAKAIAFRLVQQRPHWTHTEFFAALVVEAQKAGDTEVEAWAHANRDQIMETLFEPVLDLLLKESAQEAAAQEANFAASVKVGDAVTWSEWVWERGITGVKSDPATSERVQFTGRVASIDRNQGLLSVDPESVTPEVRQRPRYRLPINAFKPASD